MKYTALVMNSTMKSVLRLRAVTAVTVGVVFICVIGLAVLFGTQFIGPEVNKTVLDRSVLENYLGLIMFITSFLSAGIHTSALAFQSLTREKARGSVQSLLATPLAPQDIWLGKSLGVFLPGLAFAVVMTIAALLAINHVYFVPDIGFVVTPWMIISTFVAVPLVYLALSLLVHLVGLIGKPMTANVVAQVFMPVMTALMINLAIREVPNAGSLLFAVILLSAAAVMGILVLMLRRKLTAERIILSL